GDGRKDIVADNWSEIVVLRQQPDGGFAEAFRRGSYGDVGLGDIYGDNRPEVVWSRSDGISVASLNADGSVQFTTYPFPGVADGVQLWDWTGDGRLDVVAPDHGYADTLYAGTADGLAAPVAKNNLSFAHTPLTGDFDGDGDVDAAWLDTRGWPLIVRPPR